jgi:transcriptional regulator with XRE-family HTH domain
MTRTLLGAVVGKTEQSITNYELGKQFPSAGVIGRLAVALECTEGDMFEETEEPDAALEYLHQQRRAQGFGDHPAERAVDDAARLLANRPA